MATVKLGNRPKNFRPINVSFELPDGEKAAIEVVFKYRTRSEFGKMQNEMFAEDVRSATKQDFEQLYQRIDEKNVNHLLSAIDSWNLDEPLTRDALLRIADEAPACPVAIMLAYNNACTQGYLGN